jgi:hypothetical protein
MHRELKRKHVTLTMLSDIIPQWRAKSSRNAGRDQIGMVGDIIADSRATFPGIRTLAVGTASGGSMPNCRAAPRRLRPSICTA